MEQLHKDAIEIFTKYAELHKDENLDELIKEIKSNPNILHRTNLSGHITASALVINDDKVLVIWHNFLQMYLQPGGHVDPTDTSIIAAAQREAKEETGVSVVPDERFGGVPITIEIEQIPERAERGEPAHRHYDCIFVFKVEGDDAIDMQVEEVSECKWMPIDAKWQDGALGKSLQRFARYM